MWVGLIFRCALSPGSMVDVLARDLASAAIRSYTDPVHVTDYISLRYSYV